MNLERPAWKSKDKQTVVKALYQGNEQTMLRESLGVVTQGSEGVFMKKCVKQLFTKPKIPLPDDATVIYCAIDPSGGGPSKFAICSVLRQRGTVTVGISCFIAFFITLYYHIVLYYASYRGAMYHVCPSRLFYKRLYFHCTVRVILATSHQGPLQKVRKQGAKNLIQILP